MKPFGLLTKAKRPHSQVVPAPTGYALLIFVDGLAIKIDYDTAVAAITVSLIHCLTDRPVNACRNRFNNLIVVSDRCSASDVTHQLRPGFSSNKHLTCVNKATVFSYTDVFGSSRNCIREAISFL